ncbi:MAG: hypothetical protein UV80_C0004G0044 [Candidatus Peregrinibacteria bacterium GW2011_GWF2_43_17]|nr:MAG: hypothetical protein UV80_C0004G0044 [Candidatus Peregrinibacteria bacterium GW2011_GWF2_43_17]KKT20303.1 MAG: hypothetical protein UW03_C0006G0038 [Candidatus Peregrinibacteria bacterium GW2011_GWA2_43_8]HAU39440.1 hypothetical protein [Candidatus Peregrinibacteria bacterium]
MVDLRVASCAADVDFVALAGDVQEMRDAFVALTCFGFERHEGGLASSPLEAPFDQVDVIFCCSFPGTPDNLCS